MLLQEKSVSSFLSRREKTDISPLVDDQSILSNFISHFLKRITIRQWMVQMDKCFGKLLARQAPVRTPSQPSSEFSRSYIKVNLIEYVRLRYCLRYFTVSKSDQKYARLGLDKSRIRGNGRIVKPNLKPRATKILSKTATVIWSGRAKKWISLYRKNLIFLGFVPRVLQSRIGTQSEKGAAPQ